MKMLSQHYFSFVKMFVGAGKGYARGTLRESTETGAYVGFGWGCGGIPVLKRGSFLLLPRCESASRRKSKSSDY